MIELTKWFPSNQKVCINVEHILYVGPFPENRTIIHMGGRNDQIVVTEAYDVVVDLIEKEATIIRPPVSNQKGK